MPAVTVVIATWGRGRLILPTLRSVQGQTVRDFEALVIGDNDPSDAGAAVAELADGRFRWINLAERWGTQSGPNNRGIAEARAPVVAYLGHDDVWLPGHLEALLSTYAARPELGLVASGLLSVSPGAAGEHYGVYGDTPDTSEITPNLFTPPSALSHRRALPLAPVWDRREVVKGPVDIAFTYRLVGGGVRAGTTGRITAVKWAAALHYLSYFDPDVEAQEAMLRRIAAGEADAYVAAGAEAARRAGTYGVTLPPDVLERDHRARADSSRGIVMPAAVRVGPGGAEALQGEEFRDFDWRGHTPRDGPFRWPNRNPRPRLYLPFVGEGRARIAMDVRAVAPLGWPEFGLTLDGVALPHTVRPRGRRPPFLEGVLGFEVPLRPERGVVVRFAFAPEALLRGTYARFRGLGVGTMRATPLP